MTPSLLRRFWSLIETTQSSILLKLDDASLVQWLLKQLKMQTSLNPDEAHVLSAYIDSRLILIRELAMERQAFWQ
ncbi:hypothetical protein DO97_11180 [Neosynechococcus sphagnicola sy1]|uniref:Uncharacterized protein n=1 Tax=Neosynechococcus sphagnicola sy1 TaxID=1497020 RepID=A0A098TK37_9CYAN|nr:hypothetical protein [Neosynechococcus sphagnicola]KGF72207.1 hypothetical protein DO97_11180 [Neosynechococcus sphagnicola sy1]